MLSLFGLLSISGEMFATINAVSVFSFSFSFSSGVWTQLWLYTNTMHEVKWQGSSLKPFNLMEVTTSNHRRSMRYIFIETISKLSIFFSFFFSCSLWSSKLKSYDYGLWVKREARGLKAAFKLYMPIFICFVPEKNPLAVR